MVVHLDFMKAIVTAEEVLLLDPLCQEVIPFVEQLKQQIPHKSQPKTHEVGPEAAEGLQSELPFEFQVLGIALEVVCLFVDSNVADLEQFFLIYLSAGLLCTFQKVYRWMQHDYCCAEG